MHVAWSNGKQFNAALILYFQPAFARTPPKITFLILWAAANGVH